MLAWLSPAQAVPNLRLPSPFPFSPEGVMCAFPKVRTLTWEPAKSRPPLYLQTVPDRGTQQTAGDDGQRPLSAQDAMSPSDGGLDRPSPRLQSNPRVSVIERQ